MYKQVLINAELITGKKRQETELTGRSPLGRRRSALDCTAIWEEKEEEEEEDYDIKEEEEEES